MGEKSRPIGYFNVLICFKHCSNRGIMCDECANIQGKPTEFKEVIEMACKKGKSKGKKK